MKAGPDLPIAFVESLDYEGRGVAHVEGKTIFIEGALPGELVEFETFRRKPSFERAHALCILRASPHRIEPRCASFGVCGGCSMQHLEPRAQVAAKQRVLEDNLRRIGKVRAEMLLAPIHGPTWEYRYRARFGARYVQRKGTTLVGFRERKRSYIADMPACEVVPSRISALLLPLRELINTLSIRERMPQVELAMGDTVDTLTFRNLDPLTPADETALRVFSDRHGVQVFLQPEGPDTVVLLHPPGAPQLEYRLPEFDLLFHFSPTEFTQVNPAVNRMLVRRALALLDPQPGERVGDLFCGLGNFSLAIARRGAFVHGIEGSPVLVERARANAQRNALDARCRFEARDLFKLTPEDWAALGEFDKLLVDPPRDGAIELVKALGAAGPKRVVYVSCNPGTLARDAEVMVHVNGYRLAAAGVVNMFPHTSHIESMAIFER
ncbi:MAG: 23S rRNA (uracil(1939)-C(5))-methyltransferase RlmD [Burkholderiales bacterium]